MAQNDIEFTGGIKLDVSQATKDLRAFAQEVDKVFQKTGEMVTRSLQSKNFGFSALRNPYILGLEDVDKILAAQKRKALKGRINVPEDATPEEKAAAAAINNSIAEKVARAQTSRDRLEKLTKFMNRASKYDTLYSDISGLQKLTAQDAIDPATGLGRYGVYQRYANRFLGILYGGNLAFPGIVNQAVLEKGEFYRDINRKSGSINRSALRYVQDKAYTESSLSRAGDYLLMTGQGGLQELSDIYGFDLGSDSEKVPSRVSAKAQNALTRWAQLGLSAKEHKDIILRGGLSKKAKAAEIDTYAQYMRDFIAMQKKLFPEEKGIHDSLKKLLKTDLLSFKGIGSGDAGSGVWTALAGKAAKDIFHGGIEMLESYWGESITRNTYASRQAQLSRLTTGGKVLGSVIGGVVGGLLGGPVGAGIGYSGGGEIGKLPGVFLETKYKADIKSSSDMMGRIKNKALWGSDYNTYFAKAITDTGIANGESAMSGLADKAMSFRARMMLGQVGEQEMLYMSMMPNFYAALMSGMTGPQLLSIYRNDLNAIGDPSMRYLVGQAVGNTEAFAAARSPYFSSMYNKAVPLSSYYESALTSLESGYYAGREYSMGKTMEKDVTEIFRSARRGDKTIYRGPFENSVLQRILEVASVAGGSLQPVIANVIVQLDGQDIARAVKMSDSSSDVYVNDLQLYTVGG